MYGYHSTIYIGLVKKKQLELKSFNDKTTYPKLGPRLAGRPDWLGGPIGWKDRLAWLGGQTGLYTLSVT